jgi:hypothetical protein
MPKFLIEYLCSVLTFNDLVGATLAVKVNDLGRKIDSLAESNNNKPISWPLKFNALESEAPSYAVLLKNLQGSLNTPSARKSIVDSVCSNPSQISELRKSKDDWKLIV